MEPIEPLVAIQVAVGTVIALACVIGLVRLIRGRTRR